MLTRHRTLEDFPMEHDMTDAVRMLERRRHEQKLHKLNMALTHDESKHLSSYSRKRFEAALGTKLCGSAPEQSQTDSSFFWKETRPSWQRPRHHSIAGAPGREDEQLRIVTSKRPVSEPLPRSYPPRTFNHARGSPDAYPSIQQLVKGYNSGMRVVCASPSERCKEAWVSGRVTAPGDFLLVPVVEDQPEDQEEKAEEEEPVPPRVYVPDYGEEGEDGGDGVFLDMAYFGLGDSIPEASEGLTARSKQGAQKTTKKLEETDPEKSSSNTLSPPWRCWVDDATVSSITALQEPDFQAASEDAPSPTPSPAVDGRKSPAAKTDTRPSQYEKPASPSPAPTPEPKKKASPKGKRKKGSESAEVLPEPPTPPPPVEEVAEPVPEPEAVEEEVVPVLPHSLCPSSDTKAHQAEVRLWLRKSSFTAASRTVPFYWT